MSFQRPPLFESAFKGKRGHFDRTGKISTVRLPTKNFPFGITENLKARLDRYDLLPSLRVSCSSSTKFPHAVLCITDKDP
jgi:hypothetical protein